jgi:hypothetical protein
MASSFKIARASRKGPEELVLDWGGESKWKKGERGKERRRKMEESKR